MGCNLALVEHLAHFLPATCWGANLREEFLLFPCAVCRGLFQPVCWQTNCTKRPDELVWQREVERDLGFVTRARRDGRWHWCVLESECWTMTFLDRRTAELLQFTCRSCVGSIMRRLLGTSGFTQLVFGASFAMLVSIFGWKSSGRWHCNPIQVIRLDTKCINRDFILLVIWQTQRVVIIAFRN